MLLVLDYVVGEADLLHLCIVDASAQAAGGEEPKRNFGVRGKTEAEFENNAGDEVVAGTGSAERGAVGGCRR